MSSDETEASLIEAGELQNTEDKMRRALGLDGSGRAPAEKSGARHGDRPTLTTSGSGSMGGPTERRKHRFVQDGEIQYTVERRRSWAPGSGAVPGLQLPRTGGNGGTPGGITGNHAPITADTATASAVQALEATLKTEQATRERMERLLRDAQTKIHDLQTNLGHATLARTEAQEVLTAAQEKIEALEAEVVELRAEVAAAQAARDAAVRARKDLADVLAMEREARATAELAIQNAVTSRLSIEAVREVVTAPRKAGAAVKATTAVRSKVKEPQPVKWWIKTKPATKKA